MFTPPGHNPLTRRGRPFGFGGSTGGTIAACIAGASASIVFKTSSKRKTEAAGSLAPVSQLETVD